MPTNPYTAPAISGYNSGPPPDDGSQTTANELTWAKHKTKLADPIKTYADDTNTNVTAAFAKVINTDADENNAVAGSLAFTESELTIATGAVVATRTAHSIDTEADAATDDLDTITASSVSTGAWLLIRANNAGRTIVVKHGTGNILLDDNADFSLDDDEKRLLLQYNGTSWIEVSRSTQLTTSSKFRTSTATTSGTSVDITTVPTGTDEITISLEVVSQDTAGQAVLLQLGDSGGFETSGYSGSMSRHVGASNHAQTASSAGFILGDNQAAAATLTGQVILKHMGSNVWSFSASMTDDSNAEVYTASGNKTLSGELTQTRLTTAAGTATFDAGTMYLYSVVHPS